MRIDDNRLAVNRGSRSPVRPAGSQRSQRTRSIHPKSHRPVRARWKAPAILLFVASFVVMGALVISRNYATTSILTKTWSTNTDWTTSSLLGQVDVTNDNVALTATAATAISSTVNLALNKPVVTSSTGQDGQGHLLYASAGVDGNPSTRWSSADTDDQWIYVDLGTTYRVNEVKLNWAAAYGRSYQIQVSNDASQWSTIYDTTQGTSGVNDLKKLTGSGRYVRMLGIKRGTGVGYSLLEFEVYGAALSSGTTASIYASSGTITLNYDASAAVHWAELIPRAGVPTGTDITYQVRTSADNANWSAWRSAIAQAANSRYIQIQATLRTDNTTISPALQILTVAYSPVTSDSTATLTASATTISVGQEAVLSWSSTNATACTASGAWSGTKATAGSMSTGGLTQTGTYNLVCNGEGGSADAAVTITVTSGSLPSASPSSSTSASPSAAPSASPSSSPSRAVGGGPVAGGPVGGGGPIGGGPIGGGAGGCTSGGAVAPCIGGATTGAGGWGSPAFADEFSGTSLNTTSWANSWFNGGSMNDVSTSGANVAVSGGSLILTLSSAKTGALVSSNPNGGAGRGFEFQYGYAEARVNVPGNGSTVYNWPAWWTDGQSWPANGEIDVAEGLGGLTSNYHSSSGANNSNDISGTWTGGFHTYGVDREPGRNSIYWDGKFVRSYATNDGGAPQYLIFNVGAGSPSVTGTASQMKVDYVRVWAKK